MHYDARSNFRRSPRLASSLTTRAYHYNNFAVSYYRELVIFLVSVIIEGLKKTLQDVLKRQEGSINKVI